MGDRHTSQPAGPPGPGPAPVPDPEEVRARLGRIHERIAAAGGDPAAITVVAVTKGQPYGAVRAALLAELTHLGENYAQELVGKAGALADDAGLTDRVPVRWHAIGRLQRNKVRLLAPHVALWQSVDRPELATEIARRSPAAAVLLQVDVTGEPTKGGCPPAELGDLLTRCRDAGLEVRGLMAIGPTDTTRAPGAFAWLARLADHHDLAERSMGMSADLEAAVGAGATMVRVGTALFGPRSGGRTVGH